MKRTIVIAIVGVLILGVGIIVGYLAPRSHPTPPDELMKRQLMGMAPQMGFLMGADLKPVETTVEDWLYPDSKSAGTGKNISGSVNGKPFEFQTHASMHTADDFETVIKYYSDKLRSILSIKAKDPWSVPPQGSGCAGVNGVLVTYKTNRPFRDRPVQVGIVGMQAENCHVHFCVTRGDTEERTYITVLFSKWHVDAKASD